MVPMTASGPSARSCSRMSVPESASGRSGWRGWTPQSPAGLEPRRRANGPTACSRILKQWTSAPPSTRSVHSESGPTAAFRRPISLVNCASDPWPSLEASISKASRNRAGIMTWGRACRSSCMPCGPRVGVRRMPGRHRPRKPGSARAGREAVGVEARVGDVPAGDVGGLAQ